MSSEQKSLVQMFDELVRLQNQLLQNDCTAEFLIFVKNQEQNRLKWKESVLECNRLKRQVDDCNLKISELEKKLYAARVLVDKEREKKSRVELERDELRDQVAQIDDILSSVRRAGDKLANETKEKLDRFLSATHSKVRQNGQSKGYHLDTINEMNSTGRIRAQGTYSSSSSTQSSWSVQSGSLLSDFSFEDNLEVNKSHVVRGGFKNARRSTSPSQDEVVTKRRRSSRTQRNTNKIQRTSAEHLVATTTVTVPKVGPVTACSKIETIPEPNDVYLKPSAPPKPSSETDSDVSEALRRTPYVSSTHLYSSNKLFTRSHCFRNKTMLKPSDECGVCVKKITFGNKFFFCTDCRVMAHPECRDKVPLPCITVVETPRMNMQTTIADFCSQSSPMIPPLIVHCVIEVEARGLNEVGIYRVPGSEKDVKSLKERFLRGKAVCSLSGYDIHVICGVIKDFLRSLSEPLVTFGLWPEFIRAIEQPEPGDKILGLYQAVAQLPQPNRDTLAFMMQHLQRVDLSPDCKMSKSSLAKIFGPTIVGYSSLDLDKDNMFIETSQQAQVIEYLLNLPSEYWHNLLHENKENTHMGTPVAPGSIAKRTRSKNRNIFSTPPFK